METCLCPPLMVTGREEFTQLIGFKSGLSCKTHPVKASGHDKLNPLSVAGTMPNTGRGLKFASKVWSARAVKVTGFTVPAGRPSSVHSAEVITRRRGRGEGDARAIANDARSGHTAAFRG